MSSLASLGGRCNGRVGKYNDVLSLCQIPTPFWPQATPERLPGGGGRLMETAPPLLMHFLSEHTSPPPFPVPGAWGGGRACLTAGAPPARPGTSVSPQEAGRGGWSGWWQGSPSDDSDPSTSNQALLGGLPRGEQRDVWTKKSHQHVFFHSFSQHHTF